MGLADAGSLFATALWLAASLGFKFYVTNMGNYTETYGAIGAVMVLMLWFYISGLVILAGAEMNAEIEHASPYGKAGGEKAPGERRTIGVAAWRAWKAKQRGESGKPPSADEIRETVPSHGRTLAPSHPRTVAPSHPNRPCVVVVHWRGRRHRADVAGAEGAGHAQDARVTPPGRRPRLRAPRYGEVSPKLKRRRMRRPYNFRSLTLRTA